MSSSDSVRAKCGDSTRAKLHVLVGDLRRSSAAPLLEPQGPPRAPPSRCGPARRLGVARATSRCRAASARRVHDGARAARRRRASTVGLIGGDQPCVQREQPSPLAASEKAAARLAVEKARAEGGGGAFSARHEARRAHRRSGGKPAPIATRASCRAHRRRRRRGGAARDAATVRASARRSTNGRCNRARRAQLRATPADRARSARAASLRRCSCGGCASARGGTRLRRRPARRATIQTADFQVFIDFMSMFQPDDTVGPPARSRPSRPTRCATSACSTATPARPCFCFTPLPSANRLIASTAGMAVRAGGTRRPRGAASNPRRGGVADPRPSEPPGCSTELNPQTATAAQRSRSCASQRRSSPRRETTAARRTLGAPAGAAGAARHNASTSKRSSRRRSSASTQIVMVAGGSTGRRHRVCSRPWRAELLAGWTVAATWCGASRGRRARYGLNACRPAAAAAHRRLRIRGDAAMAATAARSRSGAAPALEELILRDNKIGDEGRTRATPSQTARRPALERNKIGDEGARHLRRRAARRARPTPSTRGHLPTSRARGARAELNLGGNPASGTAQ